MVSTKVSCRGGYVKSARGLHAFDGALLLRNRGGRAEANRRACEILHRHPWSSPLFVIFCLVVVFLCGKLLFSFRPPAESAAAMISALFVDVFRE